MHYGDVAASQFDAPEDAAGASFNFIKVFNSGEEILKIRRPRIESQDLPGVNWIDVFWAGSARGADPDRT